MRRILLVAAGASLLAACQPSQEAPTPPPVRPVLTTLAHPTDSVIFGPFAGTVEPRYQSQLGFQIGGRVVARDVTVGDVVKKGQRLAALDPIVSRFDLSRAEAELADAKAQAENATATEARTRRLMEGNNVTQAQLDAAVARRDTAQARLAQAGASLQKARDQIGYTELHADFDGVVTQRLAEIGQVVSPGQGIVTLARPETREAVVDIPETLAGAMPKDGRFTVVLQSAPEITARGRVREVAPFAESGTRTRRVRLTLEEPGPAFRLGATITVALERGIERRFVLPATALLDSEGRRSVWIVPEAGQPGNGSADDAQPGESGTRRVERRDVTLDGDGPDRNGRVAVRMGLKPGERVVVAGVHSLRDGQTVRLADDRN
ncbi:MAG TPA: efflux RND transporter periplasmic adaptor subunit [Methylobacterium sp.]|jgi:RND family efflux transporter MFP subunit|uniref:efflux RND transporter periplasmic adaptor subunit n=1 Tax=Methylorubrum sp. B1-46 TaxID=2897334 RepID=UPI001E50DBBB|nr:efflux RND transporter periplasmic adaptor subunit [Methylorubrum sp. B1-46]UGB25558.1 efflux RND transporter periplasmic adaptor subunit [Methylorubrum sp. B1-46]HEV2541286.1 efflux RND transporter periplasmic adaptor subunit [Methylobacterium sp.]